MSIATAIAALTPRVYWKLDDTSGTVAADSSGNAHPGTYTGAFVLNQPGPEAGTKAVLFNGASQVTSAAAANVNGHSYSMLLYAAFISAPVNNTIFLYNGVTNARGSGLAINATPPAANIFSPIAGGIAFGAGLGALFDSKYHLIGFTEDAARNVLVYVDGVQVGSHPAFGTNDATAADAFLVGITTGDLWYCAHAALFSAVLTPAQIASVVSAVSGTLQIPPGGGPGITQSDVTSMLDLLTNIYAAVHKVF